MLPSDYFPIQIVNSSTFPDSQISILGDGLASSGTKNQSWIQFDPSGSGTLVPAVSGESSAPYSVPLTTLPNNADNTGYVLYVPHTWGGRLRISINYDLLLTVNTNVSGDITINDPNPFDPADPNYFVIWDKVELTYGSGSININTTAVDFFGLPLTLQLDGSNTVVGLASRSEVLASISGHLTGPWENLILNFSGATTSGSGASVLRAMCPDEANGVPQQSGFPSGYLDPYISGVWSYYTSSGKLGISISGTTYTGTVSGSSFNFTDGDTTVSVSSQPTSNDVFGCNGALQASSEQTNAQTSINRVLATALNLGLLPLASTTPPAIPTLTSASWDPSTMPPYYTNNPQLPNLNSGSAWYNAYAAAIHDNGADNQGALVYAFSFDDQAGQSSLLISNTAGSAILTIGDCTGTNIPSLAAPQTWDINFTPGSNGSGSVTTNSGPISFAYPSSVTASGLSSGFQMTYNYTGTDVTYILYIVTSEELGTVMSTYPYLGIVVAGVENGTINVQLPGS